MLAAVVIVAVMSTAHIHLPYDFFQCTLCSITKDEEETTRRNVSEGEHELLARVCMSEAGTEPLEGKIAVLETVLNRVDRGDGSISEVINAPGQYSTRNNGAPNAECYEAVDAVLEFSDRYPENMLYFRTKHYHRFGTPYKQIGNHYFTLG